jgi:hypothetical protein
LGLIFVIEFFSNGSDLPKFAANGPAGFGAMGCKQDHSDARRRKKQKAPAERPKVARRLSPERIERMRIVVETLREWADGTEYRWQREAAVEA